MNRIEEFKDVFLDLLNQACGEYDRETGIFSYDSKCLSSYQEAIEFAIDQKWIKKEQYSR